MKIPRNLWILGSMLAAGIAAYVYCVFLPLGARVQAMRAESQEKLDLITGAGPLAPALIDAERQLDNTRQYVALWRQASSAVRDPGVVHARILEIARNSGVSASSLDPEPARDHAWLRETTLTMGVCGSYAQIHDFVAQLESVPWGIWVESLCFEPNSQSGGNVNCQLSLVVFSDNAGNSD